jgi:hypothetical protein
MQLLASQAWNNLLVSDDEVPSQDDAGNEPEKEPEPAAESAAEAPKAGWIGRFRRRRRVASAIEAPRDEEPPSPSGGDEEHQTADPKVHVLPEDPPTHVKQQFAQLQAMHDQENEKTSPPDGEHVTFRSVTLAELYVGAEIDALAAALQKATWVNTDEQFTEEIATARQLDAPYASEFLLRSSPASPSFRESYGETDLPAGIARIIGQLNVLGPSLTSLVLTFVLTDEEADCLDRAIRDEADANLRYTDSLVSIETVYVVKSKRVQAVLDEVGQRCATWLQGWAPGTLGVGDGIGIPLCSLISVAKGTLCETRAITDSPPPAYLRLLGLASSFNARKFARPDFMFLVPRNSQRRREYIAAFNEEEAAKTYADVSATPDILHGEIFRYMAVLALEGILDSFESRMRATRAMLASLDFGPVVESPTCWEKIQRAWGTVLRWLHINGSVASPTEQLRNQLLGLSRDIAVVCGDIKGAIDDTTWTSLWGDYPLIVSVDPNQPSSPTLYPAEVPRKVLTEAIASIKARETELRELVLVTNQAVSEDQDKKTQRSLNRLTVWLVFFTVALVVMAGFTIWETFYDAPPSRTPTPTASTPASTSTAKPTVHPKATAKPKPSPSVKPTQTHKVSRLVGPTDFVGEYSAAYCAGRQALCE